MHPLLNPLYPWAIENLWSSGWYLSFLGSGSALCEAEMGFPGTVAQNCPGFVALGSWAGTGVTSEYLTLGRKRK